MPLIGKMNININDNDLAEFTRRQLYAYIENNSHDDMVFRDDRYVDIVADASFLSNISTEGNRILSRKFSVFGRKFIYDKLIINIIGQREIHLFINKVDEFKPLYRDEIHKYAVCHEKYYRDVLFPIFALYAMGGVLFMAWLFFKNKRKSYLYSRLGWGREKYSFDHSKQEWCRNFIG